MHDRPYFLLGDAHYARREPERLARGERHGGAKMTEMEVREARKIYSESGTITAAELAEMFGMSHYAMHSALRGKTWSHVPGAITKMRKRHRAAVSQ